MSIQKKSLIGNLTAAKKAIIATNVASDKCGCGQDSEPSQSPDAGESGRSARGATSARCDLGKVDAR